MDVYLNGYEMIIYIIIKRTTMVDDSTNIVYCVFAHTIILCQGWRSGSRGLEALGLEMLIRQGTGLDTL